MRMWKVEPYLLCRKHLLGEHVECHMILGSYLKGKSLRGYVRLIELHNVISRHNLLAEEMKHRGYNHKSPMLDRHLPSFGTIHYMEGLNELKKRCRECRKRIERRNLCRL